MNPSDATPPEPPWPGNRPLPDGPRQPDPGASPPPAPGSDASPSPADDGPGAAPPVPRSAAICRRGALPWPIARGILVIPFFVALPILGMTVAQALPVAATAERLLPAGGALALLATGLLTCVLGLLAWWTWVAGESQRALGHVGPARRVPARLLVGTLAGIAIMTAVVGGGVLTDAWEIGLPDRTPWTGIAAWTAVLALAAYVEELFFRGQLLQEFGRRHLGIGVVVSSVIFALIHLGNPNVMSGGPIAFALLCVNIVLAGVLLSAAFVLAGDLWFPSGLHLGWNWAQAVLFGLPVSGLDLPSILDGEMRAGAPAWAGSAFGPESSAVAAILLAALSAGAWALVARRGVRLPVSDQAEKSRAPDALLQEGAAIEEIEVP